MGMESRARSLLKTVSWRITASAITFAISYAFTRSITVSGGIALCEMVAKTLWYYVHERLWDRISWGRR